MAFRAVESLVDHVTGIRQRIDDLPIQVLVVFDNEYSHGITGRSLTRREI
jgi:hypothetical protein